MGLKNNFVPVGPLTDETLYIERIADNELFYQMQQMEYIMVIEPRQQGKTSLIRHLINMFYPTEWCFAYADASTLDIRTEAGWYRTLGRRICQDIKNLVNETSLKTPQDSNEWRDFLSEISIHARQAGKKIVIVLDEIGGAKFDNNSLFFSILREIHTTRRVQIDSEFQNLNFILVGSFNPRDLIKNPDISPFNVAQKIEIDDFSVEQIQMLMRKRGWTKDQAAFLSERLHHWTSGQPYLTQYLCSRLDINSTLNEVDLEAEKLIREDTNNLPHIVKAINSNKNLHDYLIRIGRGESIPYNPNQHPWQDQLNLLGLIKSDVQNNCEIRNRIYQKVIVDLTQNRKGLNERLHGIQAIPSKIFNWIFIDLPHIIGRAILDVFGREKALDSTAISLGYVLYIVITLLLWGIIDIESLIKKFVTVWRFFIPVK